LGTSLDIGTLSAKTITLGKDGTKTVINEKAVWNRYVFITAITPIHHRTDTRDINGVKHYKNVLEGYVSGVVVSLRDGESDEGKIAEYGQQHLSTGMIIDAMGWCDGHPKGPHKGDCNWL
jgi:hypothetical protein